MKEFVAMLTFCNNGEKKIYRHHKVCYYTKGNVFFLKFVVENAGYTIAIYSNKVYIYAANSLKYKLKLQLHEQMENLISTPHGQFFASTYLQKLKYTTTPKCNILLEYILNISGFEQAFYLQLIEE